MLSRDPHHLAAWLTTLARAGLKDLAWLLDHPIDPTRATHLFEAFADEAGDRKPIHALLLADVARVPLPTDALARLQTHAQHDPALTLWLCAASGTPIPALTPHGPLFPHLRDRGIEAWTDAELSGLHALSLSKDQHTPRIDHAIGWLTAQMQPDNGTNRPWAAHAFLHRWITHADTDARLYAETLIHNCRVTLGVPDRFSAIILASSARHLLSPSPPNENKTGSTPVP